MEQHLWVHKYQPQLVQDCILPERIKNRFLNLIKDNQTLDLILSGPPGTGKTTAAIAYCKEMDIEWHMINASRDLNIHMVRNDIDEFASTMSLTHADKKKMIIFDEADNMDVEKVQKSLRGAIEEYKDHCGFIFTCNYENKIIDPIKSRCPSVSFAYSVEESKDMMKQFACVVFDILDKEEVKYDKKAAARFIKKKFPDMRKCLNELQSYSKINPDSGIDSGILSSSISKERLRFLWNICKSNQWREMTQWAADNTDIVTGNSTTIFSDLDSVSEEFVTPHSLPHIVLLLNEYQYKHGFVQDQVLNFKALMTEIMGVAQFK